jgi:hypothetical protein
MLWARMLAYITGTVDQELLPRNEYLAAENLWLANCYFACRRACNIVFCPRVRRIELVVAEAPDSILARDTNPSACGAHIL